jgi:prepilin-type N-terminal cleavage/methylation domain-containing protein
MNKKIARKGFTLLEILLVITAIGILASIVLLAINPNRQIAQVRNTVRQADINTIQKALEQYLINNGRYPSSIRITPGYICNTETEQIGGITNCSGRVDLRELVPTYLAAIPKDPQATGTNTGYKASIKIGNNKISITADLSENKLISINPLSMVQDGLVLHLDAGNQSSYSGTGNTWFDLSDNISNRTIMNNIPFDNSGGGNFSFNGSPHCIIPVSTSETTTSLSDNVSASIWIKFPIGYGNLGWNSIFAKRGYGGVMNYGMSYNPGTTNIFQWYFGGTSGIVSLAVPLYSSFEENSWTQVSAVFSKNGSSTDAYLYKNGVPLSYSSLSGNMTAKSVDLRIGCYGNNTFGNTEYAKINIAQVSIYNLALTPEEVQQNFNGTRGRFGL